MYTCSSNCHGSWQLVHGSCHAWCALVISKVWLRHCLPAPIQPFPLPAPIQPFPLPASIHLFHLPAPIPIQPFHLPVPIYLFCPPTFIHLFYLQAFLYHISIAILSMHLVNASVTLLNRRKTLLPWTIMQVTETEHSMKDFFSNNVTSRLSNNYNLETAQVG